MKKVTSHFNEKVDVLIKGGTALTLCTNHKKIEDCAIGIKEDTIVGIFRLEKGKDLSIEAKEVIDAKGCVVMPGLINAHTHAAMVCFRGLADDLPLMDWLHNHIFPAESLNVNEELVYYGTMLACAEMIKSGTTTFCDGYFFEDQAFQAVKEAGMRAILAQGVIDFPTPDVKNPEENVKNAENYIIRHKKNNLISPAVFCHSLYTCSSQTLKESKELSKKHNVFFLIHLSETLGEVQQIREKYGISPVNYLKKLGVLDENLIANHCVYLEDNEIDILKEYGVKIIHNPESNMKLASGVAPVPDFISRGIPVGLGTDGGASNNNLDMFQEMDTTAKLHKVIRGNPTIMNARQVVKMATRGSAKVLGLSQKVGTIEVGKKADIIIIDMNQPHLTPLFNIYSHLVYCVNGSDVKTVIINGKLILKDRKLTTIDEGRIMEQVRRFALKAKTSLNKMNSGIDFNTKKS
ncbi:MAG: amidohydrolase [Thermodesulfobacteriota bacterium]|nr:amidohydrolase [Thermodesulfobacteriota bacterium]